MDIFSEQEIILTSGWRGAGKTWMGLSVVDAITRGESFGPWKVRNSVPCLYCDGEMAAQDISSRLNLLSPDAVRLNPLHIYSDAYANLLGLPKANLLSETWRMTMKRILITRGVKFWIIDNIASLASGIDENSKKDWDKINTWLIDLRFAGITTMLLHHVGKEGQQRGTSAREDNIDMSIILKQPPGYVPDHGACFILSFNKTRLSFEDLSLIQEHKFQLTRNENGRFGWEWGNVRGEIRQEVLKLLDQDLPYDDIAAALGISKGRISQIKKDAIEAGQMNKGGRLITH
jgi:putative DNA primase/helicase